MRQPGATEPVLFSANPSNVPSARTLFCDYCKRKGHTKDRCWDKNLFPWPKQYSSAQTSRKSQAFIAKTEQNTIEDQYGVVCLPSKSAAESAASNETWYINSGASCHMTRISSCFSKLECVEPYQFHMGDKSPLEAEGQENVVLLIKIGSVVKKCTLENVLFVPSLEQSLILAQCLVAKA